MKKIQLIFIFALIGYCFTADPDKCTSGFQDILRTKCEGIDSCVFEQNYSEMCISKKDNECSKGNGDPNICNYIFHKEFPPTKCDYTYNVNKDCIRLDLTCSQLNSPSLFDNINYDRDRETCHKFNAASGKKCLLDNSLECKEFFESCEGLNQIECQGYNSNPIYNLLPDYKQECFWDGSSCKTRYRTCDTTLKNVNEEICESLKSSDDDNKKCVFSVTSTGTECKAMPLCSKISPGLNEDNCKNVIPLARKANQAYKLDYEHKCKYVEATTSPAKPASCIIDSELRFCNEYDGDDASICETLKAKDPNKVCIIDPNESDGHKCREEYETCSKYSDNQVNKDRAGCEDLIMRDKNVKCIYNIEEDKCVSEQVYQSCEEYSGISQKICESIKPTPHSRCVLDKDLKCKERAFLCSEVFDVESCLYYAKASTSNKRCEFKPSTTHPEIGECYEEYLRCEDYFPVDPSITCSDIKLHNGKNCEHAPNSDRCISKNKTCSDPTITTKGECNLISESGVSNSDKLVCRWLNYDKNGNSANYNCIETYKYCSDYKGNSQNFCENNIQPYLETGDKIDITSKCEYESNIGCQKIPKKCSDANGNPALCALISPKINDNEKMYCAYIGNQCKKQYKECEYWDVYTDTETSCTDNIPENYLDKPCQIKEVDNKKICYKSKMCNVYPFGPTTVTSDANSENLCHSIGHECEFSSDGCTTKKEYSCNDIKFYKDSDDNEEICKGADTSVPYKFCTLKEDRSGCEEFINITYLISPSDSTIQENSATLISKGIRLILILLCLLI